MTRPLVAVDLAGPLVHRGLRADELAPLGVVGLRQQRPHRHVDELGIAVEGLAVGIGELGALHPRVHEIGIGGGELVEVEALEQRQHLQQHWALRPGMGLHHAIVAVVEVDRLLDGRQPFRHVMGREHTLVPPAADVHHLSCAAERIDRLGDEALAPGAPRPLDLRLAPAAAGLGLLQDALVGLGVPHVGEERVGRRHLAAGQIDGGRGRPVLAEELLDRGYGGAGALDQRIAVAGVSDGRLQHVAQPERAEVAQDHHVGLERARHAGGQQAGAWDDVEPEVVAIVRDRCAGRRRALSAHDDGLLRLGVVEHDGHVAAGPAQVRFHHLQREGRGDAGVERVAAALQGAHADRGPDPMGGGDDPEGPVDLRPGREGA